jgi:hypothetical protein
VAARLAFRHDERRRAYLADDLRLLASAFLAFLKRLRLARLPRRDMLRPEHVFTCIAAVIARRSEANSARSVVTALRALNERKGLRYFLYHRLG